MADPYQDEKFWDQYGAYLVESRERHKGAISTLLRYQGGESTDTVAPSVIDFGCGQYASAASLMPHPHTYLGIDKHKPGMRHTAMCEVSFVEGDYLERVKQTIVPTCFTSLFSAECTSYQDHNRKFYNWIFEAYPTLNYGIVSGFYYLSRWRDELVNETGNITSCQSTGPLTDFTDSSLLYTETKLEIPAPSKMFGPNVVEVWKLLERK